MQLISLGLSHHTAPVELREQLAFTTPSLRVALRRLAASTGDGPVEESVVLHTCNRTEIYAATGDPSASRDVLLDFLAEMGGLPREQLAKQLTTRRDEQAVRHLMRVAAGLDSMVVGEAEILGQTRAALTEARAHGASGPVLDALFTGAVRAGRRARDETEIGVRAASVPSAAVELALRSAGNLAQRHIVVVGAGETGVLTARALMSKGAHSIIVSNRSYERAVELAREWNGCAVTFDRLVDVVADADIVITSTGAPHPVLSREEMARAMDARAERTLVVVDIAVPRDVEPAAGDLAGVALYDIDDVQAVVEHNLAERAACIPEVERICDEETARFTGWLATLDVTPTIADLRLWAEEVREHELERALRKLGALSARDKEVVRALSVAIVGKLLHPPTARLKDHARGQAGYRYSEALRELFDLEPRHPDSIAAHEQADGVDSADDRLDGADEARLPAPEPEVEPADAEHPPGEHPVPETQAARANGSG